MPDDPITIKGLSEFRKQLRTLDKEAPKALKALHRESANLVVDWARPRVPVRKGKAQRSVRSTSTAAESRVTGGGARVPYFPWLDFGGRVGRKRFVTRAFLPGGRYVYAGYDARKSDIQEKLVSDIVGLMRDLGWEVRHDS